MQGKCTINYKTFVALCENNKKLDIISEKWHTMELDILKEAIEEVLQVYIKEISLESTFETDLGADSIDMVQILNLVEEKMGIEIPNIELEKMITVKDALDVLLSVKNK